MVKIYYQDNEIVVCEKPYGISSQKSLGKSLVELLGEELGCEIYPVHRLDTQTTGLIVYAKTKESAGILSKEISEGNFSKKYLIVCHGELSSEGEMHDFLFHDKLKNKSFVKKSKTASAKSASLEYKLICTKCGEECEILSLALVKLHTGRTHQIRVQFASRGFALYGDGKYGAKDNDKIALHSTELRFKHPKTKKMLEFSSNPEGKIWELFKSETEK